MDREMIDMEKKIDISVLAEILKHQKCFARGYKFADAFAGDRKHHKASKVAELVDFPESATEWGDVLRTSEIRISGTRYLLRYLMDKQTSVIKDCEVVLL